MKKDFYNYGKLEVKTDCFAYIKRKVPKSSEPEEGRCNCLTDLFCEKEKCKFYRGL